jgi:hypothetical protein
MPWKKKLPLKNKPLFKKVKMVMPYSSSNQVNMNALKSSMVKISILKPTAMVTPLVN